MAEETFDVFYKAACEVFGEEKFTIKPIQVSEEELAEFNKRSGTSITLKQIQELQEVWLLKDECPRCGSELSYSFEWGIVHGTGKCVDCGGSVYLKYYHYVGESRIPIRAYSLIGF